MYYILPVGSDVSKYHDKYMYFSYIKYVYIFSLL